MLDDGGARAVARGPDRRRNAAAAAADGEEVETMLRHFTPRRGLGHGRDGRTPVSPAGQWNGRRFAAAVNGVPSAIESVSMKSSSPAPW